jgi:hypothetical protein
MYRAKLQKIAEKEDLNILEVWERIRKQKEDNLLREKLIAE